MYSPLIFFLFRLETNGDIFAQFYLPVFLYHFFCQLKSLFFCKTLVRRVALLFDSVGVLRRGAGAFRAPPSSQISVMGNVPGTDSYRDHVVISF